ASEGRNVDVRFHEKIDHGSIGKSVKDCHYSRYLDEARNDGIVFWRNGALVRQDESSINVGDISDSKYSWNTRCEGRLRYYSRRAKCLVDSALESNKGRHR